MRAVVLLHLPAGTPHKPVRDEVSDVDLRAAAMFLSLGKALSASLLLWKASIRPFVFVLAVSGAPQHWSLL